MIKQFNTEQEQFWAEAYAEDYISKNNSFSQVLGVDAWKKMLAKSSNILNILECGCNIGRNINFLNTSIPESKKNIIEISDAAYSYVINNFKIDKSFNGAIVDSQFADGQFDLVFTMGVLIHIHPDNLILNMKKMFDYSSRYILIGEYFNRTPVTLDYQGQKDKLFKRDFGKMFMENFDVTSIDYGFLWGHFYDTAGFDDINWWLFEKN